MLEKALIVVKVKKPCAPSDKYLVISIRKEKVEESWR